MTWQHLRAFIQHKTPDYFTEFRGVDVENINATEKLLQIKLPGAYRDFLVDMGNDKSFNAFGRAVHDFNFLAANHSGKHFPNYFFRISHDPLNDLNSPIDLFIDLRDTFGYDTPLYEYEPYGDFAYSRVVKLRLSLMEYLTRQVLFKFIPLKEKILQCYYVDEFLVFLQAKGFQEALPTQVNIKYYAKEGVSILIEMDDPVFDEIVANVYIAGNAADEESLLIQLLKKFVDSSDA